MPNTKCNRSDCFACTNGRCRCLDDVEFKHKDGSIRECPFYKNRNEYNRSILRNKEE